MVEGLRLNLVWRDGRFGVEAEVKHCMMKEKNIEK